MQFQTTIKTKYICDFLLKYNTEGIVLALLVGELQSQESGSQDETGKFRRDLRISRQIYHSQQGKDRKQNSVLDQVIHLSNSLFLSD